MTHQPEDSAATTGTSSFEWWYMAQFAFGAIHSGFIPILIPTYVMSITGKATDVGIVICIYGFGALLAPAIGSLTDKWQAYRASQLAGLASYVLGALVFVFASDRLLLALGTGFLGVGTATMYVINSSFIVGASFSQKMESRALTRLNQIGKVGQILGALVVAGLTQAGLSFSARFSIMAGVATGCLLFTAATNRGAAARIKNAGPEAVEAVSATKVPLRNALTSTFGLFLLAAICANAGLEMMYGQYPNYMHDVFQISPALSATALSVGALLTLLVLDLGGRWMGRSGPSPVWLTAVGVRIITAGALIPLAFLVPVSVLLPLGLYIVLRSSMSWANLTQPPLARSLSKTTLGTTQGVLTGALVIGFMAGNMSGGWLADAFGFESIPWAVAGLSVAALLLGYLAIKRSRSEHPQEVRVSSRVVQVDLSDGDKSVA